MSVAVFGPIVAVLIMMALFGVGLYLSARQQRARDAGFRAFVERRGGRSRKETNGRLAADLDVAGRRVTVSTLQRGAKPSVSWTACTTRVADTSFRLDLPPQRGAFTKSVLDAAGFQDVEFGDQAFDDRFLVRTGDEARLRGVLEPGLRARLVALAESHVPFHLRLSEGELRLELAGGCDGGRFDEQLASSLDLLSSLAERVDPR